MFIKYEKLCNETFIIYIINVTKCHAAIEVFYFVTLLYNSSPSLTEILRSRILFFFFFFHYSEMKLRNMNAYHLSAYFRRFNQEIFSDNPRRWPYHQKSEFEPTP